MASFKLLLGHGSTQINTDKNIFYALRAGLSKRLRLEENIYNVPEHSAKSFNTRADHRSSIFNLPEGL